MKASRWRRVVSVTSLLVLVGCSPAPASTPSASAPSAPSATQESLRPAPSHDSSPVPSASPEPAAPAWSELDVSGPAAREDHTWTVDSSGTTAFLFGGRNGAEIYGDLWAFDLADETWSVIDTAGGPAPRFGHEATWVEGVGLVIFAGQAGATFFNDLWTFEPERRAWRQLPAGGDVPVARYGTRASIGPDGRLWISHGFTSDGTRFADTKAYDFADGSWTDETPAGDLPVSRCLHGCWWTADGRLTLFGGQTTGVTALDDRWLLEPGEGWTQVNAASPGPRNLYARARLDGSTLLFGGQGLDGSRLGDAWLLPDGGADATRLDAGDAAPSGRSGAEMVGDVERGRLLLFGGLGTDGALDDVWQLTGDLPISR